jgi:tRNA(Ile)-lysidine synthase
MKPRVAVAYSGGRDSTALLHATLVAAQAQGAEVFALHVHHGLSPHADEWLDACAAQCRRWARRGLPVHWAFERLATKPPPGESVEAWARQARYRALRTMALAHGVSLVLLGQHRRDQAETFLLQALRSAGAAGLAAMPRLVEREGVTWARPWLERPREEIDAYVRRHRLRHVDDESNADERFARNRLRHRVWPALTEAFPQAEAAFADAARRAHEAAVCAEELAALDLPSLECDGRLDVGRWRGLPAVRGANVLRAWLRLRLGTAPPATLVERLMNELATSRSARWPVDGGELRLYRGMLQHDASRPPAAARREAGLSVRAVGRHALPGWGGALEVSRVKEGGVPLAWLARLELREREGGEHFQAGIGRPPRSLKKQFQAAAVPAWAREGPLVYSGGQLVFVPGLGLDARVLALPGQPQVTLQWRPD